MISRGRVPVGLLVLCALSVCAVAAASASASELTAVTCEDEALVVGLNAHCETGTIGDFKTVAIPVGITTAVAGTSTGAAGEEPMLRGTIGGLNVTIKCSVSHLMGAWIKNTEPSQGVHKIESEGWLRDTTCHALLKSKETRFCAVEEVTGPSPGTIGVIATNQLEGGPVGSEHQIKAQPVPGAKGVLAKFNIKAKGSVPAEESECPFNAEVNVEVTGSVEGESNTTIHSHLTFTEANNGSSLLVNGGSAKYVDTIGGYMAGEPNVTVGTQTFT